MSEISFLNYLEILITVCFKFSYLYIVCFHRVAFFLFIGFSTCHIKSFPQISSVFLLFA